MRTEFLENEYWYGGAAHLGHMFPAGKSADITVDLVTADDIPDQYSPLFISNRGRYIHSDKPFVIHFANGIIEAEGSGYIELSDGHGSLKGAQTAAAKKYYRLEGRIPEKAFFEAPQFNTWIELMYNQNQRQILEYARSVADSGIEPGVLMIDEGWAPDYGDYDFCARKFSDPAGMVQELHDLGFKVMLWVVPFISPDSGCYRELRDTDILIKDKDGEHAIRKWWNGHSAVLDLSSPEARGWFASKLDGVMRKYGVDGFKFDAGGAYLYRSDDLTYTRQESAEHTRSFDSFAGRYGFSELRCVWDSGGAPVVCRLQDKLPAWENRGGYELGLASLIPNMLAQGLIGYFYGCPDMVGGGGYAEFLKKGYRTDEELYIRWLETSLLCPMIQFSASPKRVLPQAGFETVLSLLSERKNYTDTILKLAENASLSGEPIMRYLEYEFPGEGLETVTDCFMLGSDILVAPVTKKGAAKRRLRLPHGEWHYRDGTVYTGGTEIAVDAPLGVLPVFERDRR